MLFEDTSNNSLRNGRYVWDRFSKSAATKGVYVTHVNGVKVHSGCHLEDILPLHVRARHTPVYISGIEIARENDYAGGVPDLVLKGNDLLTLVSDWLGVRSKKSKWPPTLHPDGHGAITMYENIHPFTLALQTASVQQDPFSTANCDCSW